MKRVHTRQLIHICAALLLISISVAGTSAQQTNPPPPQPTTQEQADDVLRITTELVQTDVSVFDKQGRFIDGLKREDFELRVDDKPVELFSFERVAAGTVNEEAQLAAARGDSSARAKDAGAKPLDRGRVVAFFVDDLHMAFDSLKRVKDTINRYIDKEMGQNDLVAITSASGQIGFLQQYTDNKAVLRAAVARLTYKTFDTRDMQRPPMSAYQALLIDRGDMDVSSYFVEETLRQNPGITPQMAQSMVSERASFILQQMARYSTITLSTLENLARSAAPLSGRKLVFFISDGFFLDARSSDSLDRIRRITDASARSGVVIYSMDAKGLVTGMPDASSDAPFDPSGRLQRATGGEVSATQDILNAVALETGGRFVRNTNVLDPGLTKALKETSLYYLLAWRPDPESQRGGKFRRIEVGVKNRPELVVRVQRGFFEARPEKKQKESAKAKEKAPADPLNKAIGALFPQTALPTRLTLSYMDVRDSGMMLVASMKIEGRAVRFEQSSGRPAAVIDVAGSVIDAQGKQLSGFRERLTATPTDSGATNLKLPDITYNYRAPLKPGLYQVRVAARDDASGQTGSATQWIEIPDLSKQQLSMSSLIVGERKPAAAEKEKKDESLIESVPLNVEHRFERSSHLRFLVYVYNARRGASASAQPDVALQVQIFRDDQPVVTTPLRKIETESQDFARLAYAAEIPLQTMGVGQYILQVTAIDRIAKTSASQRFKFEVQ